MKIPILIYGDLNLKTLSVESSLKFHHELAHHLKVKVFDNYDSPFPEPGRRNKATRAGINKFGKPVFSRIDFILTNLNITTEWSHNIFLSDHEIVLIHIL